MAEYISKEALRDDIRESYLKLQEIYETLRYERERDICSGELGTFCEVLMRIKDFPSADVAPVRHGRWDKGTETMRSGSVFVGHICSCCGRFNVSASNYCPNCGARMDGE